jgi:transcriptional regulator with XRE-family HTH domain
MLLVSNTIASSTQRRNPMARAHLDIPALYAALEKERLARGGMSWRAVAGECEISPSTLSRMANRHAPSADAFAALVAWLQTDPHDYIVSEPLAERVDQPDLLTQLAPLLRARRDLSVQDVEYLEDLIGAAIKRFRSDQAEA